MRSETILYLPVAIALALTSAPAGAQTPASEPADDESGNKLHRTPNDVHRLLVEDGPKLDMRPQQDGGTLATSAVIRSEFPFNDVIPSWNVDVPPGAGFRVELRLGLAGSEEWTPFLYFSMWGNVPPVIDKVLRDEHGFINEDYFQSTTRFDRLQYRIHLYPGRHRHAMPVIRRVALAYSNTLDDPELARQFRKPIDPGGTELWARRLPVPLRSQNWQDESIRGLICSPTSVSMVLAYRGVDLPTLRVCEMLWDPEYRMYGNWWRAVQAAYMFGVPGYLERFGNWNAVKRHIARGEPIIASVRIEKGDLRTAPNRASGGHLIVIAGFDADGNVHVNDPAGRTPERGLLTFAREDAEKIWFAHGGVGYVLEARRASNSASNPAAGGP